jgi:hypothetical protein
MSAADSGSPGSTSKEALRSAVAQPARTTGGARTELRLIDTQAPGAEYEARWYLGRAAHDDTDGAQPDAHGVATIGATGNVTITVAEGHLPDWLQTFTEKLLRTTARSVQEGRFPRRLTRWRDGDD